MFRTPPLLLRSYTTLPNEAPSETNESASRRCPETDDYQTVLRVLARGLLGHDVDTMAGKRKQEYGSSASKKAKTDEQKYYGVQVGRRPGVYRLYSDCQQQINGFPGAKCESPRFSLVPAAAVLLTMLVAQSRASSLPRRLAITSTASRSRRNRGRTGSTRSRGAG